VERNKCGAVGSNLNIDLTPQPQLVGCKMVWSPAFRRSDVRISIEQGVFKIILFATRPITDGSTSVAAPRKSALIKLERPQFHRSAMFIAPSHKPKPSFCYEIGQ